MFYGNLGNPTANLCTWGNMYNNHNNPDPLNVVQMFTDSGCPVTSSPVYDSATNTYSPLCHICDNNVP